MALRCPLEADDGPASGRSVYRPPSFFQAFPKIRLFSPRISKECLGGFVRFQRLAIVPNPKVVSKLFALQIVSPKDPRRRPNKLDGNSSCFESSTNCAFPEEEIDILLR